MGAIRKLLCKFGFHKWSREKKLIQMSSNVIDHSQYCTVCMKQKRWTTPRD